MNEIAYTATDTASTAANAPWALRLPRPKPPKKNPKRTRIAAIEAKKLAIVITITSRLITCVSSCASTPSSSAGVNSSSRPVVAQIVAVFCERPSAQAFGILALMTATRGFGRSACTQSRSMIECSSGAWATETSLAPIADSAILSDANS